MQQVCSAVLLVVLLAGGSPLSARTLAGVELPEQVTLKADGSRLVLNGAGVVRHFFTDLLVGALYLPRRQKHAGSVLALPGVTRVQIHVLYERIGVGELEQAWLECLAGMDDAVERERLLPQLTALLQLLPDLSRGDVLAVDLYPGEGARLHLNGRLRGSVAGDAVSHALLVTWLGDAPVDAGVKRAMLGRG